MGDLKNHQKIIIPEYFTSLEWKKISCVLSNIIHSDKSKAHFLSVLESIRKGICSLAHVSVQNVICRAVDKRTDFFILPHKPFAVEFLIIGLPEKDTTKWIACLYEYFSKQVQVDGRANNFKLCGTPHIQTFNAYEFCNSFPISFEHNEYCLNFLTPLFIKQLQGKWAGYIDEKQFIHLFTTRIKTFFNIPENKITLLDSFKIIPCYWDNTPISHNSKSQKGSIQYIKGYTGKLFIKGNISEIAPYIMLCSELHAGVQISNSQGYFVIEDKCTFFDTKLTDKAYLTKSIQKAVEHYDYLQEHEDFVQKISQLDTYVEHIVSILISDNYIPPHYTAFCLKTGNKERRIEKPSPDDIIIQFYLHGLLQPYFDRCFEDESVAFRKGFSAKKVVKKIAQAIHEGYQYIVKSDIEDFFPSINISHLLHILSLYIPKNDVMLKRIIWKYINTGYELHGNLYQREKGIAQGAVLSPLLSNLYLDAFDEIIKSYDVRLIRFADDFIILTKTLQDAHAMLDIIDSSLQIADLHRKEEKTSLCHISEQFTFLGVTFTTEGPLYVSDTDYRVLQKPLYITEPYAFLKRNGDSLHVMKNKDVLGIYPLKRVCGIQIMAQSVFSTSLIQYCSNKSIPITITGSSGYFITTVTANNKNNFSLASLHFQKHQLLREHEILLFAKEFAKTKIINYQTLFKHRYVKYDAEFHHKLKTFIADMDNALDIHVLRGLEGAATKLIYAKTNSLLNNKAFILKKRDRMGDDPMNSMLNYCSYLLFMTINSTIRVNGLNPYLGFLHSSQNTYESLTADIQEIFRVFSGRIILRMVNLHIIKETDFVVAKNNRLYFSTEARKKCIIEYEKMLQTEIHGQSIKDHIFKQVYAFVLWAKENKMPHFFIWK
ncbi:MAG: CRISPR-associated endonuclease Cas1 [bacterium]